MGIRIAGEEVLEVDSQPRKRNGIRANSRAVASNGDGSFPLHRHSLRKSWESTAGESNATRLTVFQWQCKKNQKIIKYCRWQLGGSNLNLTINVNDTINDNIDNDNDDSRHKHFFSPGQNCDWSPVWCQWTDVSSGSQCYWPWPAHRDTCPQCSATLGTPFPPTLAASNLARWIVRDIRRCIGRCIGRFTTGC